MLIVLARGTCLGRGVLTCSYAAVSAKFLSQSGQCTGRQSSQTHLRNWFGHFIGRVAVGNMLSGGDGEEEEVDDVALSLRPNG